MKSDTYFCIYCSKQFDNEIYYTMHSRICNSSYVADKKSEIIPPKIQNDVMLKEKLDSEEHLYCEICGASFTLNEFEAYQNHIENCLCFNEEGKDNHNHIHYKPDHNENSDVASELYSSQEKEESYHPGNYTVNQHFIVANPHEYHDNQQFYINNGGIHFEGNFNNEIEDDSLEEDAEEEEGAGLSQNELSLFNEQPFIAGENKESEVCNICQEEFKNKEMIIRLPCFHAYHSKEIIKWLKMSVCCPSCKLNIQEELNLN